MSFPNANRIATQGFTLIDQSAKRGFTLIELSIVLIIIGLITSGILIGRELIHAAEIRAAVRQVEEFNAAVGTFMGKYNCLPGDCARAGDFGFDANTDGDGNDTIGCAANNMVMCPNIAVPATVQMREYVNFWYHLSAAGLIGNAVLPYDQDADNQYTGIVTPPLKMASIAGFNTGGSLAGWAIRPDMDFDNGSGTSSRGAHNFMIGYIALARTSEDYGALFPADAYAIDAKLDDGLPLSGTTVAWKVAFIATIMMPAGTAVESGACVNNDTTPPSYNAWTTDPASYCSPFIKAVF